MVWVFVNLVEVAEGKFYSTAYLVDNEGKIAGTYCKVHLGEVGRTWTTSGIDSLSSALPLVLSA